MGRFNSAIDELEWLLKVTPEDRERILSLLPEVIEEAKRERQKVYRSDYDEE